MYQQLYSSIDDIEQTLYFLNGHGSKIFDFTGEQTFFIDLPFYFNRATSLSVPTSALLKQQMEIVINLKNLEESFTSAQMDVQNGSFGHQSDQTLKS